MEIIGLICEYNPFHNGHVYHINQIKKKYPDSLLILCLNGYFLERGEISILTKEEKTRISLFYGIDIVVELPTLYGCQSADSFANAAITILNHLKVQKIIFGSETNEISKLMMDAQKQLSLSKEELKQKLKKGTSYQKSLLTLLKEDQIPPNDLLGISYCKVILTKKLPILLETIQRTSKYHDTTSKEPIISASNIRQKLKNNIDISPYVPPIVKKKIIKDNEQDYFDFLKHRILTDQYLETILDVKEGFENKLRKEIPFCHTLNELKSHIKSKRYPQNYINRMLIHIFLGLYKKDCKTPISYIKILGFNEKGKQYLKKERKNISLPTTPNKTSFLYQFEQKASQLYDLITKENTYEFEKKNQPIYIKTADCTIESNQK